MLPNRLETFGAGEAGAAVGVDFAKRFRIAILKAIVENRESSASNLVHDFG